MDLQAILKARGLSDENITTLLTNPAYAPILEGFVKDAEDGKTALLKAKEIETNLQNWNQNEVIPYVRKADMKVAEVEAKNAALSKHLETLKAQGYDIPESMLPANVKVEPVVATPVGIKPEDFEARTFDIARTNMELISLSNKYRGLTGNELDLNDEYSDFGTNKRPNETLRSYIDRKYDLAGLSAKKAEAKAAADRKAIGEAAVEEWKKANPISANPEIARPAASKFDRLRNVEGDRAKAWQTAEGRDKATRDRLSKYTTLVTQ